MYPPAALIAGGVTVCALAGSGAADERRRRELSRARRIAKNERLRILRNEGAVVDDE